MSDEWLAAREGECRWAEDVLDHAPVGTALADLAGSWLHWNEAFERVVARDVEGLRGIVFEELLHEDDRAALVALRTGLLEGDSSRFDTESRYSRSGASFGWLQISVSLVRDETRGPRCYLYQVCDITARKEMERDLAFERERLELAVQGTSDGLWYWEVDSEDVWYSPRFKALLGYGEGEFPGRLDSFATRLHPEDRDRTWKCVRSHLESDEPYDIEYRLRTKSGAYRWFRARGRAIRGEDGSARTFAGSIQDVTDKIEARISLERAKRQAEEASRVKSDFLANTSHEIRTPLTAIMGFVESLIDDELTDDERRDALTIVLENAHFLLGLINDLLDLCKIESGKMQVEQLSFSPSELLESVIKLVTPKARAEDLKLEVRAVTPIPATITSDPTRMRQVLLNLLSNAIKFTDVGTILVLVAHRKEDTGAVLDFSVTDSGIGMTGAQTDAVFEPFVQADTSTTRKFGGSGLGLAVSKGLIESLGGELEVWSREGSGSMFRATIPVGEASGEWSEELDACRLVELDQKKRDETSLSGRVLLAEDNRVNQKLISRVLVNAGAEVEIVSNGQQAVERLLSTEGEFDVLLLDMQMPIMDGYRAAEVLRAEGSSIPIIALTACAMSTDRGKCLDAGCTDYATKPIDRPVLLQKIGRALAASRLAVD